MLKISGRVRWEGAISISLVVPERADAGQERMHFSELPGIFLHVWRERGGIRQHERGVELPLRDELDLLSVLHLILKIHNRARRSLDGHGCSSIRLLAFNDKLVGAEVCEYVAVEAMCTASVKGSSRNASTSVEDGLGEEVNVRGDDDVEGLVEGRILIVADISGDDIDFDARIQLLDLGSCCFGALECVREARERPADGTHVLAYVGLADEELRA